MIFQKNPTNYLETEIDNESVLMNLGSGKFNALKGTGLAVWQAIDGIRDLAEIKALMANTYKVSPAVCAAEVDSFVSELKEAGFIVAV